jgi:curved DNA-binding protein CbpA
VATHYEVLGVAKDASPAAIRAAYLAKARVLHPDRQVGRSRAEMAAAQRSMQDVNVAWNVLGDPRARRDYDNSLRPRATTTASTAARPMPRTQRPMVVLEQDRPAEPLPFLVRVAPVVILAGVLLTIIVVMAFAAGGQLVDFDSGGSEQTDAPVVDSCIDVGRFEITTVDCESPEALRVERVVTRVSACREDEVPVPWEEDEVLCVRPKS